MRRIRPAGKRSRGKLNRREWHSGMGGLGKNSIRTLIKNIYKSGMYLGNTMRAAIRPVRKIAWFIGNIDVASRDT